MVLSDRLRPVLLAPIITLTLGAGVGASVRAASAPATEPSTSAGNAAPAPVQSSSPSAPDDAVRAYAREHDFAFEDPPSPSGAFDRWDPCVPIHYVVNNMTHTPDALTEIDDAFSTVGVASGMHFVDDGPTRERPADDRRDIRRTAHGWRWAPVLIALVPHAQFRRSPGTTDLVAYTEPDVYGDQDGQVSEIVSGEIVVDASQLSDQGAESPDGLRPILLHEIGHLVGLGHVRSHGEIMQPDGGGVVGLGSGDLAGLQYVGAAAGCLVDPAVPRDSAYFPK